MISKAVTHFNDNNSFIALKIHGSLAYLPLSKNILCVCLAEHVTRWVNITCLCSRLVEKGPTQRTIWKIVTRTLYSLQCDTPYRGHPTNFFTSVVS